MWVWVVYWLTCWQERVWRCWISWIWYFMPYHWVQWDRIVKIAAERVWTFHDRTAHVTFLTFALWLCCIWADWKRLAIARVLMLSQSSLREAVRCRACTEAWDCSVINGRGRAPLIVVPDTGTRPQTKQDRAGAGCHAQSPSSRKPLCYWGHRISGDDSRGELSRGELLLVGCFDYKESRLRSGLCCEAETGIY